MSGGQAPDADHAIPLGLRCNPPSSTQPDVLRFKPEDMRAKRPVPGALPRGELSGLTLLPPLVRIAGPEKDGVDTRGRGDAGPAGLAEVAPVGVEELEACWPLGVLGLLLLVVLGAVAKGVRQLEARLGGRRLRDWEGLGAAGIADGSEGRMPIITDVQVASLVLLWACWPLGDAAGTSEWLGWLCQAGEVGVVGPPAAVTRPLAPSLPSPYDWDGYVKMPEADFERLDVAAREGVKGLPEGDCWPLAIRGVSVTVKREPARLGPPPEQSIPSSSSTPSKI